MRRYKVLFKLHRFSSYNWLKRNGKIICFLHTELIGYTGGAICKVSNSLTRATRKSWVQAPAAIFAWLIRYLLKSLMMSILHNASVLDKLPWVLYNLLLGAVLVSCWVQSLSWCWVRFPTWTRNFKLLKVSFEFCEWVVKLNLPLDWLLEHA